MSSSFQIPKAHLPLPKAPGWVAEFRAFIARGNVIDLAVGIIIGAAFTGIVNSLVKDCSIPCSAWRSAGSTSATISSR